MQKYRRLLVLLALGAQGVNAQTVRGVVVTPDSTRVPGVILTLVDAGGAPVARALANDSGAYSMRAPSPGTYRIEARRIAFHPTLDAEIALAEGRTLLHTVTLVGAPVRIGALHVSASARCERGSDPASSALDVWEEARKALQASQLTRLTRAYTADITTFVVFQENGAPSTKTGDSSTHSGMPLRPFVSRPAEELAERGYAVRTGQREIYRAPDEDVLLSETFAETHCLRVLPDSNGSDLVRLGFSPLPGRTQSDISGILTVDRASSELRRLDFTFVNIPNVAGGGQPGGEIAFRHLSEGSWIMEKWAIRLPTEYSKVLSTERRQKEIAQRSSAAALVRPIAIQRFGLQTTGGYVQRVAFGQETVWRRETPASP